MSSYVLKVLAPDERVVHAATLHWIIYTQGFFFTIAGGAFGYYAPQIALLMFGDSELGHHLIKPLAGVALVVVVAGIALLAGAYVRQTSTELVITNKRVIAKYGFISRSTFELLLSRVTGVNFEQTVWGRILGFGTIIVHGAGSDISPIDLVADPQIFHNRLMSVLERTKGLD